jgi:hypothetical protein
MADNLARYELPEDDHFNSRQRSHRHLSVVPHNRQNSVLQGYHPRPEDSGEEEIIIEVGLWVVFNRRILSWIKRKQQPR